MADYGDEYYFQHMRNQKPGATGKGYVNYVIVSEDSTIERMCICLADGVRSAGFNGAVNSKTLAGVHRTLTTTDWVGVADVDYAFEFVINRRASPGSSLSEINVQGSRFGATYENGWTPTRYSVGVVTISPPTEFLPGGTIRDPAWDRDAYVQSTTIPADEGGWAATGGGHRDYAWASPTGETKVYRGDVILCEKVVPTSPPKIFDNLSGNATNESSELDFYPHTKWPRYYHEGDKQPAGKPVGVQKQSADTDEGGNRIYCIPDVMNQQIKAREGGVTIVFKRV